MKIAIISDIHGNNEALDAVLKDIELQNCDKIFCLGDLAMAGPEPSKVIKRLRNLVQAGNFATIQGNTDEKLGDFDKDFEKMLDEHVPVMAHAYRADLKELSDEDKEYLKNLPKTMTIIENGIEILLVHGSPRKNDENITSDIPMEQLEEIIANTDAEVIFCGHTHVPCGFATNSRKTVVNAGSVGRPFSENPKSCYAIINLTDDGFEIEHRLIDYDFNTAAEKLKSRNFEGSDKLATMLIKASSRYPQ